ncbi:MAG: primosomal protein N', partial [Arenicellales bacterium WSBS_2016_MAG_OTU3]
MAELSHFPFVKVAIPSPLRRCFDYRWPAAFGKPIPGTRVQLFFGNRRVVGIIESVMQTSDLPATKLKCVERVLGEQAVLVEPTLSLARWTAAYYHHSLGEVFAMALPLALRKGKRAMPETPLIYRLSITGQILDANTLQRAP